jgi:hypothetical protein
MDDNIIFRIQKTGTTILVWKDRTGTGDFYSVSGYIPKTNIFTLLTITVSGTTIKLYENGILKTTSITSGNEEIAISTSNIGRDNKDQYYFDGKLDEFKIFNRSLNTTEISNLYNYGNINGSSISPNFSVYVTDKWDGSDVNNISVLIDDTTYTNSTGNTVTTSLLQNDTSTYLIQVSANDYFSKNYSNTNVSSNLAAELYQSIITFDLEEFFSGDSLSGNVTIDGVTKTDSETWYLSAGTYNATASVVGYIDLVSEFNVSALDNKNIVLSGIYDSLVNFTLNDVVTTDLIAVSSYVNISSLAGFSGSYSSVNGSIENIALLQGNYSVTVWADDYAYSYQNISVNSSSQGFIYSLYSYNSVWVTAKDSLSGVNLSNFTVDVYNALNTYQLSDGLTGLVKFNNITSGVYSALITKDGYSSTSYVLTVTGGSHQNLIAYLIDDSSSSIFTIKDIVSSSIIEDAQVSMYKSINSSWALVASKNSDITGRVQFSYSPNIEYKFVVDKLGYDQRTFFLEILFSTYTIRMTPNSTSIPDVNIGEWVYEISNYGYFYDDMVNNFSVSISSGTGTLEYYYLNVTNFDGVVSSFTCLNSYGCSDDLSFNITDATWNQTINVSYSIKETGRALKNFKTFYIIQNTAPEDTVHGWSDAGGDGFGSLEKAIAATILMLLIVGGVAVASLSLGVPAITASGIALAVTAGLMASVDFIPNYAAWLIGLGVLLIVVFGRGEI